MMETKCVCGVSYYFGNAWDHVNCKVPDIAEKAISLATTSLTEKAEIKKQPTLHLPNIVKKRGRPPKTIIDNNKDVI